MQSLKPFPCKHKWKVRSVSRAHSLILVICCYRGCMKEGTVLNVTHEEFAAMEINQVWEANHRVEDIT